MSIRPVKTHFILRFRRPVESEYKKERAGGRHYEKRRVPQSVVPRGKWDTRLAGIGVCGGKIAALAGA